MSLYQYTALDRLGKKVKGKLTASNSFDLENKLREFGLDLLTSKEVVVRKGLFPRKVKSRELILTCIHMEQLDRAGVPLLDAIADLRDTTESDSLRNLMSDVYEAVKGGDILSEALAKHPRVFNNVFTGLIAAGERTGKLADSFKHLADHIKWAEDIRRKVKKAVRYPMISFVVVVASLTILMTVAVPKITGFLLSQEFTLPWYTTLLIDTSNFFVDQWYFIVGIPVLLFFAATLARRYSERFAYVYDRFVLILPLIGNNVRKIDLARFTHFFSITFQSGIDILECLDTAHNVVGNRVVKEAITIVKQSVTEGNSITSSLRLSGQFPSLVIRMFKVGEESGEMGRSLENINFFYEREVNDSIDSTIEYINPIMLVVVGGMLIWITAAVFGPLYSNLANIGM